MCHKCQDTQDYRQWSIVLNLIRSSRVRARSTVSRALTVDNLQIQLSAAKERHRIVCTHLSISLRFTLDSSLLDGSQYQFRLPNPTVWSRSLPKWGHPNRCHQTFTILRTFHPHRCQKLSLKLRTSEIRRLKCLGGGSRVSPIWIARQTGTAILCAVQS